MPVSTEALDPHTYCFSASLVTYVKHCEHEESTSYPLSGLHPGYGVNAHKRVSLAGAYNCDAIPTFIMNRMSSVLISRLMLNLRDPGLNELPQHATHSQADPLETSKPHSPLIFARQTRTEGSQVQSTMSSGGRVISSGIDESSHDCS